MKVVLVGINSKYIHTNLAIRYLRSSIKSLPVEASIYEPTINNHFDDLLTQINNLKPDILAFSCYIWNIELVLKLSSSIRKVNPDINIVLGGPEVSFETRNFFTFHPYIDYIIKGEGEIPFHNLIRAILSGQKAEDIAGIMTTDKDNGHGETMDLSNRDFPYDNENLNSLTQQILYYETSRGCPFNCSYCLSSTTRGVRYVDIEKVKSELKIICKYTSMVKFVDRTFNSDTKRTVEILHFIKELDTNTTFHLEISAHLINIEILELLKKMPLNRVQLEIGVQTTNIDSTNAIKRSTDFSKIKTIVETINSYGNIHQHLDLIAALPYEDYNSFKKSFNDVMKLKPHKLQLGFLKLLKGSKIRKEKSIHGYKFNEFPPYEVLENKYITFAELTRLKGIEALLETYYNSQKFQKTTESLHKQLGYFNTYEKLYEFFIRKNLMGLNISHNDYYGLLLEFISENNLDQDFYTQLLKFDYLTHKRTTTLPDFFGQNSKLKEQIFEFLKRGENIEKCLPNLMGQKPTQIYKQIIVQEFAINPLTNNETKTFILFNYSLRQGLFQHPQIIQLDLK